MTTAIEKETDMSNDNEIYPLDEYEGTESLIGSGAKRSVNQRLAPIFRALLDDPDGWSREHHTDGEWEPLDWWPLNHKALDNFRLVRKRKTISVENLPLPKNLAHRDADQGPGVFIPYSSWEEADSAIEAIRKAMEGK